MPLAERPLRPFAHEREGLRQHVLEALTVLDAVAEFFGLVEQAFVAQRLELRFEVVHFIDDGAEPFQLPFIGVAEDFPKLQH